MVHILYQVVAFGSLLPRAIMMFQISKNLTKLFCFRRIEIIFEYFYQFLMLFRAFLSIFSTSARLRQPTSRTRKYYPMGTKAICTHPPQHARWDKVPIREDVLWKKDSWWSDGIYFVSNGTIWLIFAKSHHDLPNLKKSDQSIFCRRM